MAKIKARKNINAIEQEKVLEELNRQDKKKKVQRVTIDFPVFIYDKVKQETEETGQTLKGFMIGLIREHFAKKNQ